MSNKNLNIIELITANLDPDQANHNFEQILAIRVDAVTFKHIKKLFRLIKHHQAKAEKPSLLRVQIIGPALEVDNG